MLQKKAKGEMHNETDSIRSEVEKNILINDMKIGSVSKAMQIKIGAYLSNIMCRALKFRCGQ